MSTTEPLRLAPIPASIDNPDDWSLVGAQIERATGLPLSLTPEVLSKLVAGAVPLLFASDSERQADRLRGTFADPVVAQRRLNVGDLLAERPTAVTITLVGSRVVDGHPTVRVRLTIQVDTVTGAPGVNRQFWDLQVGGQVTVAASSCPNCGAPIDAGELICSHCETDVRSVVETPLVVSHIDLY